MAGLTRTASETLAARRLAHSLGDVADRALGGNLARRRQPACAGELVARTAWAAGAAEGGAAAGTQECGLGHDQLLGAPQAVPGVGTGAGKRRNRFWCADGVRCASRGNAGEPFLLGLAHVRCDGAPELLGRRIVAQSRAAE